MKKVTVNGKVGHVTSVNPQRNGKYQVWFEGEQKCTQVDKKDVVFEKEVIITTNTGMGNLSDAQTKSLMESIPDLYLKR